MMAEAKPCPCINCHTRKYFAKVYDIHFFGDDCFYVCPEYDKWKAEQENAHAHPLANENT